MIKNHGRQIWRSPEPHILSVMPRAFRAYSHSRHRAQPNTRQVWYFTPARIRQSRRRKDQMNVIEKCFQELIR
jgi:hypothetical protein